MGIFNKDRKDSNPPPDYDAAMQQHSAAGATSSSSNPGRNPPLKPGMAGHAYAEIAPPPAHEQASAAFKSDPREGWQVTPQQHAQMQQQAYGAVGQGMQYSEMPGGPGAAAGPMMHWYRNAQGHTIQSPLPPSHPAMQCLMQGRHVSDRRFGILGIIMGVLFCPLGCVWTALDYQVSCKRCGEVIDEGCYSC